MAMENPQESVLTNITVPILEESPCPSPIEPSKLNNNNNNNNDLPNKASDTIIDPADVVKAGEKLIDSDPRDKYYVKEEKESNQKLLHEQHHQAKALEECTSFDHFSSIKKMKYGHLRHHRYHNYYNHLDDHHNHSDNHTRGSCSSPKDKCVPKIIMNGYIDAAFFEEKDLSCFSIGYCIPISDLKEMEQQFQHNQKHQQHEYGYQYYLLIVALVLYCFVFIYNV
jgi:hypothetical protein